MMPEKPSGGRNPRRVCSAGELANLPAGLEGKASNGHAMDGTARTGWSTLLGVSKVTRAVGATGELDDKTLAHKVGTV